MSNNSYNNLWSRFKDGDDDALAKLYKVYANELYSYGLKIARDENLVKDCIQEAFIQIIDKRKTLLISSRTHIYLFITLRNKIFEETRTKSRKQIILNKIAENSNVLEKDVEQSFIASEEESRIQKEIKEAIEKLTGRQKEAIYLRYTQEFDYEEIAELLNIDVPSVRTLVYRSLKSIKETLSNRSLLLLFIINRFIRKRYSLPC